MKAPVFILSFMLAIIVMGAVGSLGTSTAATSSRSVLVLNLHEGIDPGSSQFISSELSGVNSTNTVVVVIDMNTPGGILQDMLQIISAINNTIDNRGVPVYTYVPQYGSAASAGSYIAMASTAVYMGNATVIGPSTPVVFGGTSQQQNHTTSFFMAYMRTLAEHNHHNINASELMVSQDRAYTGSEAISAGVVNGYSHNLTTFLTLMGLGNYPIVTQNPNLYDNFLSFLSNTTVDGFLILIGVIAIFADIYHGTAILTIAGVALIALGLVGAEIVNASLVGIILILLGAIFIFLEAKTGHGFSLIAGVIVAIIGIFMLASPFLSSNPGYSPSPYGLSDYIAAVLIGVVVVFLGFLIRRIAISLRAKKYTGSESLIGKNATVKRDLKPMGVVSVEGIQWRCRSEDGSVISTNEKVVVVGREDLVLVVRRPQP